MSWNADSTDEQLLFQEPFLKITYHPGQSMIALRWTKYATGADYRRGLEFALDFVRRNNVRYWLADLRLMSAILQPEVKWTNEDWFPRLIQAGVLRKMALLPSSDFFNQMSVDRIMDYSAGAFTFQVGYFPTEEELLAWLFERKAEEVELG